MSTDIPIPHFYRPLPRTGDALSACADCLSIPTDPTFTEHHEPSRITARLEYLRQEIRTERISYSELAELADLAPFIDPGDVELLQWAGVPELPDDAAID